MSLNPRITDLGDLVRMDWTPLDIPDCQGYRFSVDGVVVSRGFHSAQSSTTFSKPDSGQHDYGVQTIFATGPIEKVTWPVAPPPGQILMDGRWERGLPPARSWSGSKAGVWDFLQQQGGTSLTLFDDPAGKSARLSVGANTNSVEAIKEISSAGVPAPDGAPWMGVTDYYAMRYRFSSDRPATSWGGALINQLRYPTLRYHSIGLVEQADYLRWAMNTGKITWQVPPTPGSDPSTWRNTFEYERNFTAYPSNKFLANLGKWIYIVIKVRNSTRFDGEIGIWTRAQGETQWVKTLELLNVPTQQWGVGILAAIEPNSLYTEMTVDGKFAKDTSLIYRPIDKFGLYSFRSVARTLENGGFVRASTLEAAQASLNPI